MFRWRESKSNARLNYKVSLNFPQRYTVNTYWNVFQWKSKRGSSQVDPFFVLNVGNRSDGTMYFYLYDWQTRRAYAQSVKNILVGQWTDVEAYYQCAGDSTGRVTFWQDGTLLFDVRNVRTRYADGDCQWSVDNYSSGLSPSPATIYIDDARISVPGETDAAPNPGTSTPSPAPAAPPLGAGTTALPTPTLGTAYAATLRASGGVEPHSWTVASGQLPPGLNLQTDGRLHGTPAAPGQFSARARVRDAAGATAERTLQMTVSSPVNVLWSADFETGDDSQWYAPSTGPTGSFGGGQYNSGSGYSRASTEAAEGGRYSLKMNLSTPPEGGTRMVRWRETQAHPALYYEASFNFPQRVAVRNYWNVLQWKSKRGSGQTDPFFVLNVGNRPDGTMYFYLYDWQRKRSFTQSAKNITVGAWTKVEAFYHSAGDGTGSVKIWQDGTLLFDIPNVSTRYADGDTQWSLDSYSDALTPSPANIFIDNVKIYRK